MKELKEQIKSIIARTLFQDTVEAVERFDDSKRALQEATDQITELLQPLDKAKIDYQQHIIRQQMRRHREDIKIIADLRRQIAGLQPLDVESVRDIIANELFGVPWDKVRSHYRRDINTAVHKIAVRSVGRRVWEEDEPIAKAIHYPDCWDTMAYPTLASALWEMTEVHEQECPTCGERQGKIEVVE